ncbi:MAG: tight adherence protein [Acidimicrobiaceae bacterium]
MILAVAAAGMAVVGGVLLVLSGLRRAPVIVARGRQREIHIDVERAAAAAVVGLVVALVTRWPVAALAAVGAGWYVPLPGRRRAGRYLDARTEAIALWTEMLRDGIGTARGLEGVLVATASSAPLPIRAEVQQMAQRLSYEPLAVVLRQLGDDLAHPIGDLVVTALELASTAGSRHVRAVLEDLAAAAYTEASMHRRVEVARQRPRTAMHTVAGIVAGFVALLLIFSQAYLEPYSSALGQLVLVVVAAYWGLGFWWMARMSRITTTERFLDAAEVSR